MKLYIEYTYFVAYHFSTYTESGHGNCTLVAYRRLKDNAILNEVGDRIIKENNFKGIAITNWKLLKIRLRFKR